MHSTFRGRLLKPRGGMLAKVPLSSEAVVCANLEIKFTQQLHSIENKIEVTIWSAAGYIGRRLTVKVGGWLVTKQGPLRVQSEDEKNLLPGEETKASVTGPSLDIFAMAQRTFLHVREFWWRSSWCHTGFNPYVRHVWSDLWGLYNVDYCMLGNMRT